MQVPPGPLWRRQSDAAFALNDENARLAPRMGDVFAANSRVKDISGGQRDDPFFARLTIMHVYRSIEHSEHLFAVVHMPAVRLVCPVQTYADAVHRRDVERTPRAVWRELAAADDFHGWLLTEEVSIVAWGAHNRAGGALRDAARMKGSR